MAEPNALALSRGNQAHRRCIRPRTPDHRLRTPHRERRFVAPTGHMLRATYRSAALACLLSSVAPCGTVLSGSDGSERITASWVSFMRLESSPSLRQWRPE